MKPDPNVNPVTGQVSPVTKADVFDAYGWPSALTDAEILERLVALNAERAREEAQGHIRSLRPEYQIPLFQKRPVGTRSTASQTSEPLSDDLNLTEPPAASQKRKSKTKAAPQKLAWPSSLPEQTKAVLAVIQNRGLKAFNAEEIARCFKRAQTAQVGEIIGTLLRGWQSTQRKTTGELHLVK
jgi:hypothetical protein